MTENETQRQDPAGIGGASSLALAQVCGVVPSLLTLHTTIATVAIVTFEVISSVARSFTSSKLA